MDLCVKTKTPSDSLEAKRTHLAYIQTYFRVTWSRQQLHRWKNLPQAGERVETA